MTPAARAAAAIGVLDRILAGSVAEVALTNWGRASRYAGSGDRAGIAGLVFMLCVTSFTIVRRGPCACRARNCRPRARRICGAGLPRLAWPAS